MKKIVSVLSILVILFSQVGCAGNNILQSYPYATPAIKQQLAEQIYDVDTTIPKDYFEVYVDYTRLAGMVMRYGLPIFGEDTEQQMFWFYVTYFRALMMLYTFSYSEQDREALTGGMGMLDGMIRRSMNGSQQTWRGIVDAAIAYEEAHPYNPYKKVELHRANLKKIVTKQDAVNMGISWEELRGFSDEEFREAVQDAVDSVQDVPSNFPMVRERVLQSFKQTAEPKK